MVSSIQKSCKRKSSSFTMKTMVICCKGCDVHVFFVGNVYEIIEAVSSLAKRWSKIKIKWIFELNVWSIVY